MELSKIGEVIASRRRDAGLTQKQLAERAGVSRATIAALETAAQRELGLTKVVSILAVLNLDLRLTDANMNRPTLEDLRVEADK